MDLASIVQDTEQSRHHFGLEMDGLTGGQSESRIPLSTWLAWGKGGGYNNGGGGGYNNAVRETVVYKNCHGSVTESKVHGANMGPTWVMSTPDGHRIGPMNLAIRVSLNLELFIFGAQCLLSSNCRFANSKHVSLNVIAFSWCVWLIWLDWMHIDKGSFIFSLIVRFMGPTLGTSGADRTQVGLMLALLTLLFWVNSIKNRCLVIWIYWITGHSQVIL